jgi:hypothetical protein
MTEKDRLPQAEGGDQLSDILHMTLKVVAGGGFVAEPMTPEIDANEANRGSEALGQCPESVCHACRAVDTQDGRLASRPIDGVKRHVLQRDEFLAGQRGSGRGPTLEAQYE